MHEEAKVDFLHPTSPLAVTFPVARIIIELICPADGREQKKERKRRRWKSVNCAGVELPPLASKVLMGTKRDVFVLEFVLLRRETSTARSGSERVYVEYKARANLRTTWTHLKWIWLHLH